MLLFGSITARTKLKPLEVTTPAATTIEPHSVLDLPDPKRFYKQKRN